MRDNVIRSISGILLLLLNSCIDNQGNGVSGPEVTKQITDSFGRDNLVAGFHDAEGYSVIVDDARLTAKIGYATGYPLMLDSLDKIDTLKYRSRHDRTEYFITDSNVIVTYYQKIVHPSSNWQGQTPWQEVIVKRFPREDGK